MKVPNLGQDAGPCASLTAFDTVACFLATVYSAAASRPRFGLAAG